MEAVTFDFWNTLTRSPAPGAMSEARLRAVADACRDHRIEIEAELLAAKLEEISGRYESAWSRGSHFHPREGADLLVAALGTEGEGAEAVAEAFLTVAAAFPLRLAPGVRECLGALAERGIALGIVCDTGFSGGAVLRGFLEREGLLDRFAGWGFSDEVGHYKPAPQIFAAALATLGSSPERSLHIGDLRRTDVAGAAAFGMRTARYRGLYDDPGLDSEAEAEFVLDDHAELPALVDRL